MPRLPGSHLFGTPVAVSHRIREGEPILVNGRLWCHWRDFEYYQVRWEWDEIAADMEAARRC